MSNNSNSIPTRLISNYASEMKEQIIDLLKGIILKKEIRNSPYSYL
ncbi:MAG: hypothetical protein M3250_04135 [Thermoproteota archaeon]|nr:hypothetical protein [Thermoproteota archaeon]